MKNVHPGKFLIFFGPFDNNWSVSQDLWSKKTWHCLISNLIYFGHWCFYFLAVWIPEQTDLDVCTDETTRWRRHVDANVDFKLIIIALQSHVWWALTSFNVNISFSFVLRPLTYCPHLFCCLLIYYILKFLILLFRDFFHSWDFKIVAFFREQTRLTQMHRFNSVLNPGLETVWDNTIYACKLLAEITFK